MQCFIFLLHKTSYLSLFVNLKNFAETVVNWWG